MNSAVAVQQFGRRFPDSENIQNNLNFFEANFLYTELDEKILSQREMDEIDCDSDWKQ